LQNILDESSEEIAFTGVMITSLHIPPSSAIPLPMPKIWIQELIDLGPSSARRPLRGVCSLGANIPRFNMFIVLVASQKRIVGPW
jgi:hypothetical protein